jgi:hypothetical protein
MENKHSPELLDALEYLLSDMNLSGVPIKCVQKAEKAIAKAKKENNMKLEVGKYYKASNGAKYKCVHDFENKQNTYLGRFLCATDGFNGGSLHRFHANGNNDNIYCGVNLISEWVEPVEHEVDVWFYRGIGKAIVPTKCYDEGLDVIAKIKVKFTEGEGL